MRDVGKMSLEELHDLARDLEFHPWAVGARKLIDCEIRRAQMTRNLLANVKVLSIHR